ncbi:MAG: phosphatase PAP2 family protein [Planctomycetaceae bacterium]
MDPATPRRDGDLVRRPAAATVLGVGMLAVVALLAALVVGNRAAPPLLFRVDAWWRAVVQPAGATLHAFGRAMLVLGSGWVMVPFRLVVAAWLVWRRRWWDLAAWLGAWALADLLTLVLKPGVHRWRPDHLDRHSFPSAHAKTAAQVAIGLVLVATSPWRSRAWAWAIACGWIVAMGFSRTVLDQHWTSDVVAGALLGAGCAFLVAGLAQRTRDRRPSVGP